MLTSLPACHVLLDKSLYVVTKEAEQQSLFVFEWRGDTPCGSAPPIQIYCTLAGNAFLNLRDLSVLVWIWLRNINAHGPHCIFCAYSLKIIVFCSADHRLAPPQSCSCSLSQHKPCVLRRDYQCLPLLTAQTNGRPRVLSFFLCGFWQPTPDSFMSITAISRPDLQSAKQLETKQQEWLNMK